MRDDEFDATDPTYRSDPAPDATLRALLRDERLHERIVLAARRQLMRAAPTPWYGWVARYGRAIAAVGVAAALIAAVVLNRSVNSDADAMAQAAANAATAPDLRGAVAGGSRSAVTDAVVGPDSREFLIAMVVR
jgi:negative regulator of sigma E activity